MIQSIFRIGSIRPPVSSSKSQSRVLQITTQLPAHWLRSHKDPILRYCRWLPTANRGPNWGGAVGVFNRADRRDGIYLKIISIGREYVKLYIIIVGGMFVNGSKDWGPITDQVIPKTQKIVLDTSLLNTQHYKG